MFSRVGALLLVTIALLAIGFISFAQIARDGLTQNLSRWAQQRRTEGWIVEAHLAPPPASIFAPEIGLRGINIEGGDNWFKSGFALAADDAVMRVDLFDPTVIHVTVKGNVSLRLASSPRITFTPQKLLITVKLRTESLGAEGKLGTITIDGKDLNSTGTDGSSIGLLNAVLTVTDTGASVDLRTEAIVIPVDPLGLGRHLSDVTLDAALVGFPPQIGDRRERVDIWRASGGKITISRLVAGWGPLGIVGEGEVGLDPSLQPDGSAKFEVRGYQSALNGLGGVGSLISAMNPGDDAIFDLRLKKDKLSVDRMTLLKMAPLQW